MRLSEKLHRCEGIDGKAVIMCRCEVKSSDTCIYEAEGVLQGAYKLRTWPR
jgi:hypothetical protein